MEYKVLTSSDNTTFSLPFKPVNSSIDFTEIPYVLTDVVVGYRNKATGEICTNISGMETPTISLLKLIDPHSCTKVELTPDGYVYKINCYINGSGNSISNLYSGKIFLTKNLSAPQITLNQNNGFSTLPDPSTTKKLVMVVKHQNEHNYNYLFVDDSGREVDIVGVLQDTGYDAIIYKRSWWYGGIIVDNSSDFSIDPTESGNYKLTPFKLESDNTYIIATGNLIKDLPLLGTEIPCWGATGDTWPAYWLQDTGITISFKIIDN